MYHPKQLSSGARVALVAPSGPVPSERLEPAVSAVRALGLEPVIYRSCTQAHGYLAGEDQLRATDLNAAFSNDAIDGILCIRGGYGAQRVIPLLDLEMIAAHPKFFCGYSDITALHILFNQTCGFATWHTPMPSTEWYKGLDDYTMKSLRQALFGPAFTTVENPPECPVGTLVPGKGEGVLTGGNLSLVASSMGTPYEIDTTGKILFLEDVDEKSYRLDGMLTHLRNSGKLARCAGILLGAFTNCTAPDPARSLTVQQVLDEVVAPVGVPTLQDLVCGHRLPTMSLPMGARVSLDADAGTVTVLE